MNRAGKRFALSKILTTENIRKSLTTKELNQIELLTKYFYSACEREEEKTYSKKELDELNKVLKDIWKRMSEALAQNDIETAVSYYAEAYLDSWRRRFKAFTPEVRVLKASGRFIRISGGKLVEFYLI